MKADPQQEKIGDVLAPYKPGQGLMDVIIVGAGPAGLKLAGELGRRGLKVVVVGRDLPFTNNYGVWLDEFEALGLRPTLDNTWQDSVCYYAEQTEVMGACVTRP